MRLTNASLLVIAFRLVKSACGIRTKDINDGGIDRIAASRLQLNRSIDIAFGAQKPGTFTDNRNA
jgi:hypothetical protein